MTRQRGGASTGLFAVCALVAILAVLPIAIIVIQAFQGGTSAIRDAVSASSSRTLLRNTVLVSLVATPICGVIGVGGAWFVERTRLPGRRLWALLLVAPLTVPLFVTSYAWATLGVALQGFVGAAGIIAFTYYPIVFLLVAVSLRGLDPALEDSARSLGLNPRQVFFRVILPQLRPALLGGLLLVALDALVEFDAFVALRFQTFSLDVYAQYRLGFSTSGAAALSFFSIVLCLVLLFGEARLRGDANYTRVSRGARRPPVRYELGRWKWPVLASLAAVVAIGVGIPVGMLIRWFAGSSSAALSTATGNLQFLWPASRTTILLGVSSALVALLMALPVALLAVRHRGRFARLAERSTYLSFALPDLVGAIALSYAAVHYARFLYGSFALIVFAEALLFLPFAVVAMRATVGQIEPALEDSARALGVGPLATFRRVTLPVARPGVVAAIVLVFAFSLGDLATAQVLLPLNLYTLGTEFQANSSTVAFASAAPFAAVLIVLSMAAAYVLMSGFGTVRAFTDDERG
ncbi:MAG TPA: iron ABC transporter permease [Gaiellaceae bacterium]|nr:iron ABC transporter permease [Gaiellaceae bacterium]